MFLSRKDLFSTNRLFLDRKTKWSVPEPKFLARMTKSFLKVEFSTRPTVLTSRFPNLTRLSLLPLKPHGKAHLTNLVLGLSTSHAVVLRQSAPPFPTLVPDLLTVALNSHHQSAAQAFLSLRTAFSLRAN